MVRGVRPITDIAAELTMMMANRRLAPEIETLFMIADGELAHVSSSLIKQIATVASEEELARFFRPTWSGGAAEGGGGKGLGARDQGSGIGKSPRTVSGGNGSGSDFAIRKRAAGFIPAVAGKAS